MYKKINFPLEQDEDGYPGVGSEGVWGEEESDGRFMIDNIPFYVKEVTLGDVVEAVYEEGVLRYKATVRESGNSLIRVLCYKGTDLVDAQKQLERLGCETEGSLAFRMIAVSVPPEVELNKVQAVLKRGAEDGRWDYEEPLLRQ